MQSRIMHDAHFPGFASLNQADMYLTPFDITTRGWPVGVITLKTYDAHEMKYIQLTKAIWR